MGKGGDKYEGPSPAELRKQAKGYWENYSKWAAEEAERFERDVASASARYAAGGMGRGGPGSEMVQKFQQGRKASYDAAMKKLREGEHGQYLREWFDSERGQRMEKYQDVAQGQYIEAPSGMEDPFAEYGGPPTGWYYRGYDPFSEGNEPWIKTTEQEVMRARNQIKALEGMSMEDFMAQEFGPYRKPAGSAEARATERAKKAGSGRARAAAAGADTRATGKQLAEDTKKIGATGWWA